MRWGEQYPARERRELWIATDAGRDEKLIIHTRYLPARRGHRVAVLVRRDQVVALRNLTTGDVINFYCTDPPLLWKHSDGSVLILLIAATLLYGFISEHLAWLLLVPVLVCAALALVFGRWVRCTLICRTVRRLSQLEADPSQSQRRAKAC